MEKVNWYKWLHMPLGKKVHILNIRK